jgi:hypothetical protein
MNVEVSAKWLPESEAAQLLAYGNADPAITGRLRAGAPAPVAVPLTW